MFPTPINYANYNQQYVENIREQSKEKNGQVGSLIGTGVGAAAGAFLGVPQLGAALGGMAGGAIGGSIESKSDVRNAEKLRDIGAAQVNIAETQALDQSISQGMDEAYNQQRQMRMRNVMPSPINYLKFL